MLKIIHIQTNDQGLKQRCHNYILGATMQSVGLIDSFALGENNELFVNRLMGEEEFTGGFDYNKMNLDSNFKSKVLNYFIVIIKEGDDIDSIIEKYSPSLIVLDNHQEAISKLDPLIIGFLDSSNTNCTYTIDQSQEITEVLKELHLYLNSQDILT